MHISAPRAVIHALAICSLASLIVAAQGCSRQSSIESPSVVPVIDLSQADGTRAQGDERLRSPQELQPEGQALYRHNCEPCHGPLAALVTAPSTSAGNLVGADVAKIKRSGLMTTNADKHLAITTLSDSELTAIADLLRLMAEPGAGERAAAKAAGADAAPGGATTADSTKTIAESLSTITKIIAANKKDEAAGSSGNSGNAGNSGNSGSSGSSGSDKYCKTNNGKGSDCAYECPPGSGWHCSYDGPNKTAACVIPKGMPFELCQ